MLKFTALLLAGLVATVLSQFVPEQYEPTVFANAPSITCGTWQNGTTVGGPTHGGNTAPDAFLRFTIEQDQIVELLSCGSTFDTHLRVLDLQGREVYHCDDCGSRCGSRTEILLLPNGTGMAVGDLTQRGTYNTGVGVPFPVGVEYILVIEGYGSFAGNFSIYMDCESTLAPTVSPTITMYPTPAPTDHFEDIPIDGSIECGQTLTGNSSNMGHYGGGGLHGALTGNSPDVFHSFTGAAGSSVTFSTCGTEFDTYLRVLKLSTDPSSPGSYDQVMGCDDCNQQACSNRLYLTNIIMTFDDSITEPIYVPGNTNGAELSALTAPPGQYVVQMEGFNGQSGSYSLSMACTTRAPTQFPTPGPTTLTPTPFVDPSANTGGENNSSSSTVTIIVGIIAGACVLLILIGAAVYVTTHKQTPPPMKMSGAYDNPAFGQDEGRGIDNPLYDEAGDGDNDKSGYAEVEAEESGYMDIEPGQITFAPEDDV